MEPYEELGVAPTATAAEIRRAYVRLAREFHPDHRDAADPAGEPDRMARINAAWSVLSDEVRRADYDSTRAVGRPGVGSGATIRTADATWTPLDDDGAVDPRLLDDTPTGARSIPRLVAMLPAVLFVAGAATMMLGLVLGVVPLMGIGVASAVAAVIFFVAIPVVAMLKASRAERDW